MLEKSSWRRWPCPVIGGEQGSDDTEEGREPEYTLGLAQGIKVKVDQHHPPTPWQVFKTLIVPGDCPELKQPHLHPPEPRVIHTTGLTISLLSPHPIRPCLLCIRALWQSLLYLYSAWYLLTWEECIYGIQNLHYPEKSWWKRQQVLLGLSQHPQNKHNLSTKPKNWTLVLKNNAVGSMWPHFLLQGPCIYV